jgi:diguanylate cyclase (GGDEF)-like protein
MTTDKKIEILKKPNYFVLAVSAALVVIGCILFAMEASHLIQRQQRYEDLVVLAQTIDYVEDDIEDMESGERGYLLTGNPEYLEPFDHGSYMLESHLAELQKLVARAAPEDNDMPARLQTLLKPEQDELTAIVQLYQQARHEQAIARVNTGNAKLYIDRIHQLTGDYINRYTAERQELEKNSTRRLAMAIAALIVWLASIALLVATAFWNARNAQQQLNALVERLNTEATHDALTSLPNRRYLNDWLHRAMARSARLKETVAALYIDLDGFSIVNNTYGHEMGDLALQWAAGILKDNVREGDFLARLGGDEFIVITCGQTLNQVQQLAERLVDSFASSSPSEKLPNGSLGASVGIAAAPLHAVTAEQLIIQADKAMYTAKDAGKNCYRMAPHTATQQVA